MGGPKWWDGPLELVRWLAPYGLFDVIDPTAFAPQYFDHLDRAGPHAPAERFGAIGTWHGGRPLVFYCFEAVTRPGVWAIARSSVRGLRRLMGVEVPR